jgi:ribosomal protein S17E
LDLTPKEHRQQIFDALNSILDSKCNLVAGIDFLKLQASVNETGPDPREKYPDIFDKRFPVGALVSVTIEKCTGGRASQRPFGLSAENTRVPPKQLYKSGWCHPGYNAPHYLLITSKTTVADIQALIPLWMLQESYPRVVTFTILMRSPDTQLRPRDMVNLPEIRDAEVKRIANERSKPYADRIRRKLTENNGKTKLSKKEIRAEVEKRRVKFVKDFIRDTPPSDYMQVEQGL